MLTYAAASHAGIVLGGTRIVFDGNKRETAISISNPTGKAYAVQAWVNTEADDNVTATPFIATPPLFRLDAKKEQIVRIVQMPSSLPGDRESLFFFNAQEIPVATKGQENLLKVALRTRIKFFYRPAGIKVKLAEALAMLEWRIVTQNGRPALQVNNPSPLHISFIGIKLDAKSANAEVPDPQMIAPMSEQTYTLDNFDLKVGTAITFSAINDFGGYTEPQTVNLTKAAAP